MLPVSYPQQCSQLTLGNLPDIAFQGITSNSSCRDYRVVLNLVHVCRNETEYTRIQTGILGQARLSFLLYWANSTL